MHETQMKPQSNKFLRKKQEELLQNIKYIFHYRPKISSETSVDEVAY